MNNNDNRRELTYNEVKALLAQQYGNNVEFGKENTVKSNADVEFDLERNKTDQDNITLQSAIQKNNNNK